MPGGRITPDLRDWVRTRRCWTRSEGHHGEKIKNGSFASDLRFVHISRYAIKIPGEIVWYGHYRSSSALRDITCDVHLRPFSGKVAGIDVFCWLHKTVILCRRDNCRYRNNAVRINTAFLHVVKVLDFERKLLFSALPTSDFLQVHWHVHEGYWSSHQKWCATNSGFPEAGAQGKCGILLR